ncbi:uncharacterized protein Z520_04919 [Fonsecaea multimorphosa CBS 102226]|uniref:Fungal N-terminal domain-containing protein n=1 Tax=Fonsecaea multimorphosa CBS 102226 TaxID=1442371 RepID=A0A0D2KRL2_9EURO|nr:uncharacterized protein Z520_04919 [Fonsecaea multimorphosa CBS 102226]KIX99343.1 hypothetical protein Z520_04919 [Fonsecaea multimorphosa CBS 102226]OAL25674.1 hypothetical protein AYO22_04663 [Fonsecaea multimorphosa]
MSDPFSVGSSALGVISLGLTVCQGLISYFSALKGQDQYLDSLTVRVEGLKDCLTILQRALPSWRSHTANAASRIDHSISECRSQILSLEAKLTDLQRTHGPSLVHDKLRHLTRKAIFPFKKDALVELSSTVDGLQQNLHTILQIANLQVESLFLLGRKCS